jgi:hypothetical protein
MAKAGRLYMLGYHASKVRSLPNHGVHIIAMPMLNG